MPTYDEPAVGAWSLGFWDTLSFDFNAKERLAPMLIGVDTVLNNWRVKPQVARFDNDDHIDVVIAEKAF